MVTKDQAAMLAALACACRPTGSKRWDEPGIVAALAKVSNLQLADVIHATVQAAEDASLETPAAIGNTSSPVWVHYMANRTVRTDTRNVPARERCNDCGKAEHHPIHANDHPFERVRRTEGDVAAEVAHLRTLIRTETATEGEIDG